MTLDSGDVYSAVKQFGLVAIAKETYSEGSLKMWCEQVQNDVLAGLVLEHQASMDMDSFIVDLEKQSQLILEGKSPLRGPEDQDLGL